MGKFDFSAFRHKMVHMVKVEKKTKKRTTEVKSLRMKLKEGERNANDSFLEMDETK